MAVKLTGEVYICNICGNKVSVIEVGGGTLVCCGKDMELIEYEPRTTLNIADSGG